MSVSVPNLPEDPWSVPQAVSPVEMVFPARVAHLMPEYDDIPEEFRRGRSPWNDLQATWFFEGIADAEFYPAEGIDTQAAFTHAKAIQGSFEPKHEHKEAAVAYLLSRWFVGARYAGAKSGHTVTIGTVPVSS